MLTNNQLNQVCLCHANDSTTCRYLESDDIEYGKYYCKKLRPLDKAKIDKKVQDRLDECKKKGIDPATIGEPIGDNCPGFLLLRSIPQGIPD